MDRLKELESEIYKGAGTHFNILSPMQVYQIIFVKLALPQKDIRELAKDYKICADILEYRSLARKRGYENGHKQF